MHSDAQPNSTPKARGNFLRPLAWGGAAALLLLPWIAMQFTDEVKWSAIDFIVLGTMLLVACGAFELAMRLSANLAYRLASALAVLTAFLLIWATLAVGFIGSERDAVNFVFPGMLVVGAVAAMAVRFRARGLAWVMFGLSVGQILISTVGTAMGLDVPWLPTAIFAGLWVVVGLGFLRSK